MGQLVVSQLLAVFECLMADVAGERLEITVDGFVDVVEFPQAKGFVVALVAGVKLHVDLVKTPQVTRQGLPKQKHLVAFQTLETVVYVAAYVIVHFVVVVHFYFAERDYAFVEFGVLIQVLFYEVRFG